MVINIEPIEVDGQHWVNVIIGGHEMEPRGPFSNVDEAESMARRLRGLGRALTGGSSHG